MFPLENGLHARPASHLEEAVRPFSSEILFLNKRNGRQSSARSVLDLVSTDTHAKDDCELRISGADEDAAVSALGRFIAEEYPRCDESLGDPSGSSSFHAPLPPSLQAAGLSAHFRGRVASGGLGSGEIVLLEKRGLSVPAGWTTGTPTAEREAFAKAHKAVSLRLGEEHQKATATEKAVLGAHLSMIRDPGLSARVESEIESGKSAPEAIIAAIAALCAPLSLSQSAYLRERVIDIEDLGERLIDEFREPLGETPAAALPEAAIIVAKDLTPSRLLSLDRGRIKGIVLGSAGTTSHTILLARSFGIPALVDMGQSLPSISGASFAIIDARMGVLVPEPAPGVRRYYQRLEHLNQKVRDRLSRQQLGRATKDGIHVELAANIALGEEAAMAFADGADAIGLFRTEMMYMARSTPPGEAEQYEAYAAAAKAAKGRRLIIRLVDIGGDKPVPYLSFPEEQNPFLGLRGVRWYSKNESIVRTQMRAIVRAATHGPIHVMIPMVSSVDEVRYCRRLLAEARAEIEAEIGSTPGMTPLGIMIEVPSAVFSIEDCAKEADFFSFGTNDLSQYFFAADRGNPSVSDPNQCFSPSFLRLLKTAVDASKQNDRWVGVCGEFAEHPLALPVLVALGVDEASVSRGRVHDLGRALPRLSAAHCRDLFQKALRCASSREVLEVLAQAERLESSDPALVPELVILDSASKTKEEAIREMADALRAVGRTDWPERIEAAVWKREAAYSTGFGDGFALPHCSSPDVRANSMVILRLKNPVAWQSLDGQPVDLAVMLVARAEATAKEHLVLLARFSRLLMREEFRGRLRSEPNPQVLVDFVVSSLGNGTTSRV